VREHDSQAAGGHGRGSADARAAAGLVLDAFDDYNARFADITRRARRRFERRDWRGAGRDAVERIALYGQLVDETWVRLEARFDDRVRSRSLWTAARAVYAALVEPQLDRELYRTFFNSIVRRCLRIRGVDPALEFVALDIEPTDAITRPAARRCHLADDDPAAMVARALASFGFAVPLARPGHCAGAVAATLERRLADWGPDPVHSLELLDTVFHRERRAYLVGRVFGPSRWAPLVLALVNDRDGLRVDAVLTQADQVSTLFGYTRSYFHADLATVGDAVLYLRSLLPHKPVAELYTVLGRAKQGKTERYRQFFRHLAGRPDEALVHAQGERGMVMLVFTLPSYPLVFKVIRDRFAWPKDMARDQVMARYSLVFNHDRVGRLVDAQEFRHLRIAKRQFEPGLLAELLEACRLSVVDDGDDVVLGHCYLERRLRPLDLFVREAAPAAARAALLDYGQAIRDLAASGIFPGDLLLKNFGVGRSGRVVFYDYDELVLLGECRFRAIPQARHHDEEMRAGAWYYVGPADVFPEQFPLFLGVPDALRQALLDVHGEIFDPAWWRQVQARVAAGEYADIAPYPASARLPPPSAATAAPPAPRQPG
jgi:isocitrate dehydrogenase kinase/phosphatase